MRIKVLGAHNTESRKTRYMSLLIDDIFALDAGGLTSTLSFNNQMKIKAIFVTHAHYDHIRDIPAFAMNKFLRRKTADIYTHQAAQDQILQYFLDGKIYPEFQNKPAGDPTLKFHLLEPNQESIIENYKVFPVSVNHSVPAMGYQITSTEDKTIFYTGDTGPDLSTIWNQISPQILFIELTAPDRWEESMKITGHLTPNLLKKELLLFKKIKGYLPLVIAVHMNPEGENEIKTEILKIRETSDISITLAHEGMLIEI
jgi:ribonuclease BN (tRNA processing enzyme)